VRPSRIIVACLVVAVFAGSAVGCSRSPKTSTDSGLAPAERGAASSEESSGTTDTTAQKTSTPAATSSTATTTGAPSGSGAGSNSGGSGTSTGSNKPVAPGMPVMVIFWNDANSKKLTRAEVVIGASSFKPSASAKNSRKNLGPFAYGKKIDVIVYPDGRGGKEIVVPMMLDQQMVPKSEQDAIHVAISDQTVRVLGNAILNVDQSYPRY